MKETKIYECFNVAYIRNLIKVDIWFKCWKKRGNKQTNIWVAKQEPVVYLGILVCCFSVIEISKCYNY